MPRVRKCCCDCPTKAETGLPDSILVSHSVASSSSTGIPSDSSAGSCLGGDYYRRWTGDSALADLIGATDITYDFVEGPVSSSCGSCCFHYEGQGTYEPECPEGSSADKILFGQTPFDPKATGSNVDTFTYTGTGTVGPDNCGTFECCCEPDTSISCAAACSRFIHVIDGEIQEPQEIYGTANLYICIFGNLVTVCEIISMIIPCRVFTGEDCVWEGDSLETDCFGGALGTSCSGTSEESCATISVSITMTKTADLSGVSGADIWEKIKNAPADAWRADYEYAVCSCAGGGCVDFHQHYDDTDCSVDAINCDCTGTLVEPSSTEEDEPVDIDCIYSVGEMDRTLTDAA